MGLSSGRWVKVTSRDGTIIAQALATDRVKAKELFLSMNSSENPVNRLTSNHADPAAHTPAFKEVAVLS